jgi:hypothetical protein
VGRKNTGTGDDGPAGHKAPRMLHYERRGRGWKRSSAKAPPPIAATARLSGKANLNEVAGLPGQSRADEPHFQSLDIVSPNCFSSPRKRDGATTQVLNENIAPYTTSAQTSHSVASFTAVASYDMFPHNFRPRSPLDNNEVTACSAHKLSAENRQMTNLS